VTNASKSQNVLTAARNVLTSAALNFLHKSELDKTCAICLAEQSLTDLHDEVSAFYTQGSGHLLRSKLQSQRCKSHLWVTSVTEAAGSQVDDQCSGAHTSGSTAKVSLTMHASA